MKNTILQHDATCEHCKQELSCDMAGNTHIWYEDGQIFCNKTCAEEYTNVTCNHCGRDLQGSTTVKFDGLTFCSEKCKNDYHTVDNNGRPPVYAMPFVKSYDTANTGGGCQVDCIHLHNGMMIGIDSETVVLYENQEKFDACEGEILGDITIPDPRDLCDKQYEAFLKKYDWINPTLSCEDLVSTLYESVPDDITDELIEILDAYNKLEE